MFMLKASSETKLIDQTIVSSGIKKETNFKMENSSEVFPFAQCTVMLQSRGVSNEYYKQKNMLNGRYQVSLRDLVSFVTVDPLTSHMDTSPRQCPGSHCASN